MAQHCPLLANWLNSRRLRGYKVTYLSPESQNEMIQLLADDLKAKTVEEIKEAKMFGVSVGTTPDVSKKDQMAVICRYVDVKDGVKERLLSIKAVASKTGDETAKEIIEALNSNSLNTDELFFSPMILPTRCLEGITVVNENCRIG